MTILRERAYKTRHKVSKLTIAALISWIVLSLLFCFPVTAQDTEITIVIDQGSQTADFTVYDDITIPISGNFTVRTTDAAVTVFFGVHAPGGWETSISPEETTVTFGETEIPFQGYIKPNPGSEQKMHDIFIWASAESRDYGQIDWTSSPASSARVAGFIDVIINRIYLVNDISEHHVLPDSAASYSFTVTNVATVADTFFINLVDDGALKAQGWIISTDATNITLAPGETNTFTVDQYIPEDAPEGDYEVDVVVSSSGDLESWETRTIATRVRVPEISQPFNWMPILMVGFVATGVGIAAFFAATEVGYLSFISLFLPLYVRLKKKDVLSHFTRGQIFGYIQANPGAHYNAIMQDLDLKNGVGAYHLKVLEREGYIKSLKEGIYKRFYPSTMRVPEKRLHLSRVQRDILTEIQKRPGVTQKQLSRLLDESKQVVNYHVKILESARLVRLERSGRETYLFAGKVRYVENGDVHEVVEEAGVAQPMNL
jgi:DNA-binding MarR family transcriptional regulator